MHSFGAVSLSYPLPSLLLFCYFVIHHEETQLNSEGNPNPNPRGGAKV